MHDDVWGSLVRARRHTHRSADERAHLRTNDQLGADGIAGHVRAVSWADHVADGIAGDVRAVSRADGRAHTGSDRVAGTGSDSRAHTGSDGLACRRADEGARHRPHRRDSVKCT